MRFRSKVDTWLRVTLLGSSAAIAVACVTAVRAGLSTVDALVLLPALLLGLLLPLWTLLATSYRVDGERCLIRSGPFRWEIPLDAIESVRPTRNPRSSPALSLDRLEIRYDGRYLLVSPEDKDAFLRAIGHGPG